MTLSQYLQKNEWRTLKIHRTIAEGQTKVQPYRILELAHYGKAMIIHDCIQSTEMDESFYHEALLYPPLILHGNVKRVICFGGANGGILKRLMQFPSIEEVIQIDIDPELYALSQKHLPHMHPPSPPHFRFTLDFMHPLQWLKENREKFSHWGDLIITDLPDATPDSYAPKLFTREFYQDIQKILASDGCFVMQAGQGHVFELQFHCRAVSTLQQVFPHVKSYCHFVPSYGVPWAFAIAGQQDFMEISESLLKTRIENIDAKTYDFITHQHMFHLPKLFRKALDNKVEPIDNNTLEFVEVVDRHT